MRTCGTDFGPTTMRPAPPPAGAEEAENSVPVEWASRRPAQGPLVAAPRLRQGLWMAVRRRVRAECPRARTGAPLSAVGRP